MPGSDYYQLLGVSTDVEPEALKRVYRELARQYHPDLNPDVSSAEHFKRIKEAYEVLVDPERRRAYDAVLSGVPLSDSDYGMSDSAPTGQEEAFRADVTLDFEQALRGGHTHVANGDGELVRVTIPRGCRDGTTMRIRARGGATQLGEPVDLYVCFHVRPDARFRREGNHLHVIETVSMMEAILGTKRSVRNPYGKNIKISIPAGTQPGDRLRIRGQGVQTARATGDLFVEIDVEVPRGLSDEQRAELREAARKAGLL